MLKYVVPSLLFLVWSAAFAQSPAPNLEPVKQMPAQKLAAENEAVNDGGLTYLREQLQRAQIAGVVAERQAQLKRDTEKLLALTAELKEHVDKAGSNVLSLDVIKKADEIQKLAKSVEEKMKNPY